MREHQLIDKIREIIESHVDETHTEYPLNDKAWESSGDIRKAKKADLVAFLDGQTIAFEVKTKNGRIGKAIKQAKEYQNHFDSVCIITERKPRNAIQQAIKNQGIGLWMWRDDKISFLNKGHGI